MYNVHIGSRHSISLYIMYLYIQELGYWERKMQAAEEERRERIIGGIVRTFLEKTVLEVNPRVC